MTVAALSPGLADLRFDNRFTAALPGEAESGNSRRRQVREACYSRVDPTSVTAPRLVAYSREMAERLGLSEADCSSAGFADVFSGNRLLEGMDPHASCYGGHQFGNWAGQLGDGRAINLGEVIDVGGALWMLQLKGAGPTPYSRTADGLAVLRSSLREFLCSEAMHHLGVPTTRALSLTLTGEQVMRDVLYDGNPAPEPGAVVCRVAQSFIRFGHFEILAARREPELLKRLADHTIRSHFPHLACGAAPLEREDYLAWFAEVRDATAEMIVEWMRVGFVHGVMNTDNMSILGQTIDYGPYGWLEDYDPNWTPNTTDAAGRRYRFSFQPGIAQWNLTRLAEAIYPLVDAAEPLEELLTGFETRYAESWRDMMARKLGLRSPEPADVVLLNELDEVLQLAETDMTIFFRRLADLDPGDRADDPVEVVREAYYVPEQLAGQTQERVAGWLSDYAARLRQDDFPPDDRRRAMNAVNPKYVLRNYLAQLAIDDAETGDFALVHDLLDLLRHPYDEQPERARFAARRPDWARTRVGCSMLSCSS
ncbi:MAG: YdiU family protein [Pseudomonadales bacterium]|nr:YdiU family protein [Pseudomonadales bacterium]NIX07753.1 YdiU family protein [Pseudomonadales bacterium]